MIQPPSYTGTVLLNRIAFSLDLIANWFQRKLGSWNWIYLSVFSKAVHAWAYECNPILNSIIRSPMHQDTKGKYRVISCSCIHCYVRLHILPIHTYRYCKLPKTYHMHFLDPKKDMNVCRQLAGCLHWIL